MSISRLQPPRSRLKWASVWLAVLAAMAWVKAAEARGEPGPGHLRIPLEAAASAKVGFTLMPAAQTGVAFGNHLPEARHLTNQILLNGAGVALGDVDGDGWVDLYLCASHGTNALYRNRGGWRFEAVPDAGGAGCPWLTSTGASFADLDGDGDLDLVVNTLGNGTRVFTNDGKGQFVSLGKVLNPGAAGMTTAIADVDGDGDPDLYIANYRSSGLMDLPNARATFRTVGGRLEVESVNGRPVTDPDLANRFRVGPKGEVEELGEPDAYYQNQGGMNFMLVPFDGGQFLDAEGHPLKEPPREWGLSAMFRDVNGDSWPDLYVCNDFHSPDRLWINQGEGRFRLAPMGTLRHTSRFSMAVDFADVDRDGNDDFLVVDMLSRQHGLRMRSIGDVPPPEAEIRDPLGCPQYAQNTLFLNRGGLQFLEIAQLAGIEASEWSWGCIFLDVDLDGWEDVLVSNGMERAARDPDVLERLQAMRAARRMSDGEIFEARRMYPRLATPNHAFRNRGDLTFEEMGQKWGFDHPGVSQAMALGDLDNDGDLDVVVSNLNEPAGIYRNEAGAPRVAVRLDGLAPNSRGIGARIRLIDPSGRVQSQEMIAGGRYMGGDDPSRTFAAFALTNRFTLEVRWRSGRTTRVEQVLPNHGYVIREKEGSLPGPQARVPAAESPLFEDASSRLAHRHIDEPFDDFQRQPLLPWKPSQPGPAVAWADLDGDGDDDLVVGAGKGGQLGLFRNEGAGRFAAAGTSGPTWTRETAGLAMFPQSNGTSVVLAGVSHYRDGLATGPAVRRVDFGGAVDLPLPAVTNGAAGVLALADVNVDGDLDLFVAGRIVPGRYPEAAASRLFLGRSGRFETNGVTGFPGIGMVTGSVFTDVDSDGDPDLVLACEWGPVRLLLNQSGRLEDATARWNLAEQTGLWTGITAGDFDGDGRLDLAAGNWGRNTRFQSHADHLVRLYFGDADGDGRHEVVEGWYDAALKKEVPIRRLDILGRVMPQLRERYPTHRSFAAAGLAEIVRDRLPGGQMVEARVLESSVFLNRGGRFERRALPVEAQCAPAFGICVGDANGDGREDLFLAQNFFGVQPEDPRLDAGQGLWLLGDGTGGFRPLSTTSSGVSLSGEQRGAALADFDGDGRLDLAVAQKGGETRLFRNRSGRPGLRVRCVGPPGNRVGIGAVVRVRCGDIWGPAREVHGGGGSGSQDSCNLVLGLAGSPQELEVRWPGGRRDRSALEPNQTEALVRF